MTGQATNTNPFRPSFGITPAVVIGREGIDLQVRLALEEGAGSPYRFTLISGARGSGKTVLLNLLEHTAREMGWHVIRVPASADMLTELTNVRLPELLNTIDPDAHTTTVTSGSIAGLGSISVDHTQRYTSTPSIRSLLRTAAEYAAEQHSGIFLTLDELQSAQTDLLHTFTDAVQDIVRDNLPIALAVAGLPYEVSELLQLPGTTFLRRAVPIELTTLSTTQINQLLQETAHLGHRSFTAEALSQATTATHGSVFIAQLIGSISYTLADGDTITENTVDEAIPLLRDRVNLQVIRPALRDMPDNELTYLHAAAQLTTSDAESISTAKVAEFLGKQPNSVTSARRSLIHRGLIEPAGHGYVKLTDPYLREYLLDQ